MLKEDIVKALNSITLDDAQRAEATHLELLAFFNNLKNRALVHNEAAALFNKFDDEICFLVIGMKLQELKDA